MQFLGNFFYCDKYIQKFETLISLPAGYIVKNKLLKPEKVQYQMPFFPIIYQNAGNNIFSKIWKENSYKICESSIKNYQIDVQWYS